MNPSLCLRACFLALFVLPAAAATPAATQSVAQLQRFAEEFLMQQLQAPADRARAFATAGNLDPRLRLQKCTGALQGIMPVAATGSARMTVGVRCTSPATWTVYVPMTVETDLEVLVMRSAAARNSRPAATDVEVQQRRVPGFATNYLTSVAQLQGRHLKVAVTPGTPLTVDLLVADILIKRGQRVTLVANAGGIEVHAQGEAVADATANGRVRVQNLSSRKIVEGQAESSDRVRVSL